MSKHKELIREIDAILGFYSSGIAGYSTLQKCKSQLEADERALGNIAFGASNVVDWYRETAKQTLRE